MRLYRAPRMFDGSGASMVEDAAVLIGNDGRIIEAGQAGDVSARGAEVVACEGTIMPGLIDCHVHLCLSGEADPVSQIRSEPLARIAARATAAMLRYIGAGITTVRDLGGVGNIPIELGRMVAEGRLLGPRVIAAGQMIGATGGHCHFMAREADGCDEVTKATREQIRAGADCIKVMATGGMITPGSQPGAQQMSIEELSAAVRAAHRLGRHVAAHAQGKSGIDDCVEAGIDTIEHGIWLEEKSARLMKEKGTYLVPTFSAALGIISGRGKGVPDETIDKMQVGLEAQRSSFAIAREIGVSVVAGSDAGTPLNPHGTLAGEVRALIENGLDVLDALAACTGRAARAIGLDEVGVLEPGRIADMIEIDGDPTEDPWALSLVRRVVQAGVESRSPLRPVSA